MKIVIDIPEEEYREMLVDKSSGSPFEDMMTMAVQNGTPLPKGHGRIIDESKIEVCEWVDTLEEGYPKASTDAPTIIEADGGGNKCN